MSVINLLKNGGSVDLTQTENLVEQLENALGTYPYSVTNTLTNCTSSNNATEAQASSSYSATITADEGYTLTGATVSVTMSGNDVTSTAYSNGVISIASVTGDIAISVSAVEDTPPVEYFVTFSSPSNFTLATANSTKNWDGTLEYSTDKTSWNTWAGTSAISSGADNKLYLRGIQNTYLTGGSWDNSKNWTLTGSDISVIGNIENALDYATVELGNHPSMAQYCFQNLFKNASALVDVSNLILGATNLTASCYQDMFRATNITIAPNLPATVLATACYYTMFYNCTNLTTPSPLPAVTSVANCYAYMYAGCVALNKIVKINLTGGSSGCCSYMFKGCSNIKLSQTMTGVYINTYPSPVQNQSQSSYYTDMFANTGGTFTGTPQYGATYYTSNEIIDKVEE